MKKIIKYILPVAGATSVIMPLSMVACGNTETTKTEKVEPTTPITDGAKDAKIAELEGKIATLSGEKTTLEGQVATLTSEKATLEADKARLTTERGFATEITSDLWNSFSSEKTVMGLQTYRFAKDAFDKMITQTNAELDKVQVGDTITVTAPTEGKFIPVVFMDIDDTVLNNFNFQNYNVVKNVGFDPKEWTEFVESASSKIIAGAVDFMKYVWSKGGVVMFNSNRQQATEKQGTIENLKKFGYDEKYMPSWVWWMKGVDASAEKPWDTTNGKSSKEERMKRVNTTKIDINNNSTPIQFKVVMRIGDDISDFNDNFSKSKPEGRKKAISAEDIIAELNKDSNNYGKLFGNLDPALMGVYYNPTSKTWEAEDHAESYILIAGNESYGTWVKNVLDAYVSYDGAIEKMKTWMWEGPAPKPATDATPAQ
ncbi:acid phosphatase [Mycoplasma sp. Pen4]|uniref:HAD family acid phosphatase n=1 Tax=Mycoplasma sp. Pen4 TaxID=640330 RepID=UPI001654947D|nr:HAD family acid phosphatase [Mycoplasma sp. Pen4]QNM93484.1 acid phosphatase [Mycoplasma sp. Pen4]